MLCIRDTRPQEVLKFLMSRLAESIQSASVFDLKKLNTIILIFTRYPEPGKTKTRLISVLGTEGAADLQRRMTWETLAKVVSVVHSRGVAFEICYDGGDDLLMADWLGRGLSFRRQCDGNLGEKMLKAFEHAFDQGFEYVILLGCDCPNLSQKIIEDSMSMLKESDLVLGPANDGGYYLIGLRQLHQGLFDAIPWGTKDVFKITLAIAKGLGLSVQTTKHLDDVDRPEDLQFLGSGHLQSSDPCKFPNMDIRDRISVIIPSLNEESYLSGTLESVLGIENTEIIVVDGGSTDRTVQIAQAYKVRLLSTERGRARQMNAGAAVAGGDILVFLHADTRLPHGWAEHVRNFMSRTSVACGAFAFGMAGRSKSYAVIEWLANFRSRRLQMPYGDQAIFLKSDVFGMIQGFREIPIMEDFELIRRLKKRGKISIVPTPVITSSRRWQKKGPWVTTLLNQIIILGYLLGCPPRLLARLHNGRPSPHQ